MSTPLPAPLGLEIQTTFSSTSFATTITDYRANALTLFSPLTPAQRESISRDAWSIGLRAVITAYRQSEEAQFADASNALIHKVDEKLLAHSERQHELTLRLLKQYFDPSDGAVGQRIDAFVRDGGELTRALDKYLSTDHGALGQTLARELGEHSPLMQRLDPNQANSVVALVATKMSEALALSQTHLTRALDPATSDGPLARLMTALQTDLARADHDRTKQLELATKALDANNPDSPISRLMTETGRAQLMVTRAFNTDDPASPIALLRASLTTLLGTHTQGVTEALTRLDHRQQAIEMNLRETVARLEARKQSDARSPKGGQDFESSVAAFARSVAASAPLTLDLTGARVGAIANCKVGDMVLRFTEESASAGAAVVIEAKRDLSYGVPQARIELETARKNRGAVVGLFVVAKTHDDRFAPFARYGNDVIVVWDPEDPATDPYLQAAFLLALGMASRGARQASPVADAVDDFHSRIETEVKRFAEMRQHADRIVKSADSILQALVTSESKLKLLVGRAAKTALFLRSTEVDAASDTDFEPLVLRHGAPSNETDEGAEAS